MCSKSMTQDPQLNIPCKGSHTQDFYALKKSINPGWDEPANLRSNSKYDNHGTTVVDHTWEGIADFSISIFLTFMCSAALMHEECQKYGN